MRNIDRSALLIISGIFLFFVVSIVITAVAPHYIDPSWTTPSSDYQKQVYQIADPHTYISTLATGSKDVTTVYHMEKGKTLASFEESDSVHIIAPPHLQQYVTKLGDKKLKLTSRNLLLDLPGREKSSGFNAKEVAEKLQLKLQNSWKKEHSNWKKDGMTVPKFLIYELYEPQRENLFALIKSNENMENWARKDYIIVDDSEDFREGTIYIKNPQEYRIRPFRFGRLAGWKYDPEGEAVTSLEMLKGGEMNFLSRQELITAGEKIYAEEGCWYCHTDQTRTLVQDCIMNGSETNPSPPSTANEYIFQGITMTGTRRIGPDLSRVGVKRPSRDWHKAHFWSPATANPGSIMPPFRHFFDDDPSGTPKSPYGVPNWKFEAVYLYLMTKGTRITAPDQGWWSGRDPVNVLEIFERYPISRQ